MRRLRIATYLLLSTLLMALTAASAQAGPQASWSSLTDPGAELQLNDVRSPERQAQFRSTDLTQLYTPGGNSALWLHHRMPANTDMQMLRVFAPYLAYLDLYVLQDDKLIEQAHTGSNLPFSSRPLASRDFLLPLPKVEQPLDIYLRLASEHSLRPALLCKVRRRWSPMTTVRCCSACYSAASACWWPITWYVLPTPVP